MYDIKFFPTFAATGVPVLECSVLCSRVSPNGKFYSDVSLKKSVANIKIIKISGLLKKFTMQFRKMVDTTVVLDWYYTFPQYLLPRGLLDTPCVILKSFSNLQSVAVCRDTHNSMEKDTVTLLHSAAFELAADAHCAISVRNYMACLLGGTREVMSHHYSFFARKSMKTPRVYTMLHDVPTSMNFLLTYWKKYNDWVYPKPLFVLIHENSHHRSFHYIHWTGPRAPADFLSVNCLHHQCVCHCCTSHQNRDSTHSTTHTNHYSNHDQLEEDSRNAFGLYCDGEGADTLRILSATKVLYLVLSMQLWSLAILCIHLFYCSIRSTLMRYDKKPSRLSIPEAWFIARLSFLMFQQRFPTLTEACCHCSCCFTLMLLHCNCTNALGCWTFWIYTITSTCAVLLICQFVATVDSLLVSCSHCNTPPAARLHHYFANVIYEDWSCWIHSIIFAITAFNRPFLLVFHYIQNRCQLLTNSINGILADLIPLCHICCLYFFHAVTFCYQLEPLISNVFPVRIWNDVSPCISQFATIGKLLR